MIKVKVHMSKNSIPQCIQNQAKIISPATPQIICKGVSLTGMNTKTTVSSRKQNEMKQTFESHYVFYNWFKILAAYWEALLS